MGFKETLQQLVKSMPGIRGAAIMGADGIPLELAPQDPATDLELLGAEYAVVYKDVRRAAADLHTGDTHEIMIKTAKGTVLFGGVNSDYFVMLILAPEAIGGKARFLLKQTLPQLQKEL